MNLSINLRNLYSYHNTYTKNQIATLRNLKRVFIYQDRYESDNGCLIEDLFVNNML